ncbi:hypothetical protein E8K88_07420, partial [Lampropedia aestuarii]
MINSVIFDRDHMYYSIGTQAIYVADAASNYIRSYTMFSMGGQLGVAPDINIGTNPAVFNRWNASAGRDAAYTSTSALGPKHLGNGRVSDELYMFFTGFDRRTIYAVKSGATLTGEYIGTVNSGGSLSAMTVDQNTGLLYATRLASGLNEANSYFYIYDPSGIGSEESRTISAGRIVPTDGSPTVTTLASDVTIDADGNVYVIGRTGGNAAFPAGRYLYKVVPGKTNGVLNSDGSGWTYSTTLRISAGSGTAPNCTSYPGGTTTSVYGMGFLNGVLYSNENNCLYSTNVFTGVTDPVGRITYSASFDTNPPTNTNVAGPRVPAVGVAYDMAVGQVASAVAGTIYNDTSGTANIVPGTTPGLAGVTVELYQVTNDGRVVMRGNALTGDGGQFTWLAPGNSTFYVRAVQPANDMFMTWAAGTVNQGVNVNNPVSAYCYNASGGVRDTSGLCYGVAQGRVDAPAAIVGKTYANEAAFLADVRYASKVVLQSTHANTVPQADMAFSTAPRLTIVKSGPQTIAAGTPFNYSFAVSNDRGPAFDFYLADKPPAGITLNSAPSGAAPGSCMVNGAAATFPVVGNGNTVVVCRIVLNPALAAGDSITVTWNATAAPSAAGLMPVNYASYNPDGAANPPVPGVTCTSQASCTQTAPSNPIQPGAPSLTIVKSAPAIASSAAFDYSFLITNAAAASGPANVVHIADLPPVGITLNAPPLGTTASSCTVGGAQAAFPIVGNGTTVVVCAIPLTPALAAGQSRSVTWNATAAESTVGTRPVNHASYNPDGGANPPAPGGSCAPAASCTSGMPDQPVVQGKPLLTVVKSAPAMAVNTPFNYSFVISNDAAALSAGRLVHIADLPPTGITLKEAPQNSSCTVGGAPAVFPIAGDGVTVVVCAIALAPDLLPGQTRTVVWRAVADESTQGTQPINHASYNPDGTENPPRPGVGCTPTQNCTSGTPDEPVSEGAPTLTVLKTAPAIAANTPFVYSFVVTNAADAAGPATMVHIADLPPVGITLDEAPANSSCTVGGAAAVFPVVGNGTTVVECSISLTPALQPGSVRTVLWSARADASTIGTVPVNHASYNPDGSENPPQPGGNCTPAANCTSGMPDVPVTEGAPTLTVVKTAPAIAANTPFNYSFEVSNAADAAGPATVVHIADLPPVGITLSAAPVGSSCTVSGTAAVFPVVGDGTTVVECEIALTPTLQPGDELTILWSAVADASTIGSTPVNHASYNPDGSENPPAPGPGCTPAENCTSGEPDEPVSPGAPTLSVVKTAPAIAANTPFDYSFVVTNDTNAVGSASVVHIADLPPVGVTLNAAPLGAAADACTIGGMTAEFPVLGDGATVVRCEIALTPALQPGDERIVRWSATADDSTIGTQPVNHASYNPDGSENTPEPGENCTPAENCTSGEPDEPVVEGAPNLTVVKTAPAMAANTAFNYSFVVSNADDAAGPANVVTIADMPPQGITLNGPLSGTAVGTCTVAGAAAVFPVVGDGATVVECSVALTPALQPGSERSLRWSATASVSTIGTIPVNHASYNPDGSDNPPAPGPGCTPAASCTSGEPEEPVSEGSPHLSVVKTAPAIAANTPFNYNFEVSNAVDAAGSGTEVHIADLPPVGITLNAPPSGATVNSCTVNGDDAVFPVVGDGAT